MKFCVKLDNTKSEIIEKLKLVYGNEAVGAPQIKE